MNKMFFILKAGNDKIYKLSYNERYFFQQSWIFLSQKWLVIPIPDFITFSDKNYGRAVSSFEQQTTIYR